MMIRFRIPILLFTSFFITISIAQDVMQEKSKTNKIILQKSQPYSESEGLIDKISNWIKNPFTESKSSSEDLTAAAAEYIGPQYLPPASKTRSYARNCYECNKEPWIPIIGRSLNLPQKPYFREKTNHFSNKQFNLHHPPIDQYGAPLGHFEFPPTGQVADFMLPPPYKSGAVLTGPGNFYPGPSASYGPPKPVYLPPKPKPFYNKLPSFTLSSIISPPPFPNYAPTHGYNNNNNQQITHLRPVSQDFQPPLPGGGIHNLPLENNLPPPLPSDSYGRPLQQQQQQHHFAEPITLASGDNDENLINGLTDVQVVPSLRIADYTASIEHPINLIQSPILDLNVQDNESINRHVQGSIEQTSYEDNDGKLLSENPIVVEDTHTSASNINTTYFSNVKRNNDKFLSSETDLTDNLIQKLILEQNIIEDPQSQIVGIKKGLINPQREQINLNLVPPNSVSYYSTLPTVMIPPPKPSTWLRPVNDSFVTAKNAKNLQIIVPYLKSNAIYNKEYSTLASVFNPPAMSTESSNLWTQLMEDVETLRESERVKSSTEVYNIKDFLAKNLQKNIDDWTHQAYSNKYNYATTKLTHVKNIPGEYFTTTTLSNNDHVAENSENKEFIEDNLIVNESTTKPNIRFIARQPTKPSWEENKVLLSNSTHEKVYVVTPQTYNLPLTSTPATAFSMAPRIQNGQVNNANTITKISVRVETPSEKNVRELKPVKVVYSEWPHLINNLATTTTPRPTTRHPLFGLMDLAPYTLSNSAVETISGHSKVSTVTISSTTPLTPSLSKNESKETVKITPQF